MFKRRDFPNDMYEAYLKRYEDFMQERDLACWSSKQSYILATSIMISASYIGIDSCPIEGFNQAEVEECLEIDTKKSQISLLIALGYRIKEQPSRYRLDINDLIEYR